MKNLLIFGGLLMLPAIAAVVSAGDRFETIKDRLADATCVELEFLSVVESDIFETVDTAVGRAYIAADGRYRVSIGPDEYLFDGRSLYSYSRPNAQVVIEPSTGSGSAGEEVSFLTGLDEHYRADPIEPGKRYRLIRRDGVASSLPDTMTVMLHPDSLWFESLEYFDVNDELNRIVIRQQKLYETCDTSRFAPAYPDSVERIHL